MKTCKDCIHEKLCVIIAFPDAFENTQWGKEPCDHFKDKSLVLDLPCKVGDTVYVHETFIWTDDCCHCEYFQIGGFGDPNECARTKSPFKHPDCTEIAETIATEKEIYLWLAYGDFGKTVFLTKESAEQALKEREFDEKS